jgi:RNA polymerase sigma-70 factor, ECF subfamily
MNVEIFNQHRPLLFSIAYRMTGSVSDAEDILQEAFLRWHQSRDTELHSAKSYLSAIVTRLCINHLQSARVQREKYVGPWLPEPMITADQQIAADLSTGFLLMMERLSAPERAVFLLREVFEYEYSEIAEILGKTELSPIIDAGTRADRFPTQKI